MVLPKLAQAWAGRQGQKRQLRGIADRRRLRRGDLQGISSRLRFSRVPPLGSISLLFATGRSRAISRSKRPNA